MVFKKKIIKNIIIQHILALISFIYIKIVGLTSTIIVKNIKSPESYWKSNTPFVLAFWHSQLMMISYCWESKEKINILASGHSDGRFGAIVGRYFKLNNIPILSKNKAIALKPIFKLLIKKYQMVLLESHEHPKFQLYLLVLLHQKIQN